MEDHRRFRSRAAGRGGTPRPRQLGGMPRPRSRDSSPSPPPSGLLFQRSSDEVRKPWRSRELRNLGAIMEDEDEEGLGDGAGEEKGALSC